MQSSSNVENSFNFESGSEKSKSLSPLTSYNPFQSSFNLDLGSRSPPDKKSPRQNPTIRIPNSTSSNGSSTWNNKSGGRQIFGAGNAKYSNETVESGAFATPEETKSSPEVVGNVPSWNLVMDSVGGTRWTALARPDQHHRSANPAVWFYPGGFFVPETSSLRGGYAQVRGNVNSGSAGAYLNENKPAGQKYSLRACDDESTGRTKRDALPSGKTGYDYDSSFKSQTSNSVRTNMAAKNAFKNVQKSACNRPMVCNFCKNNKEVPDIYLNHYLYDPKTKKLTCPVLRKHVCEICGETGDRAHTLQYCPVNRQRGLQAKIPVLLKTRTITNSTGKIRRN